MKWRTDKPTADLIVAKIKGGYHVLRYLNFDSVQPKETGYHDEEAHLITPDYIEKWADLEEDETVTDCDQLKDELDRWRHTHFNGKRDDKLSGEYLERTSQLDLARHFAKWGAEHRDRSLNWIRDLIKVGTKEPEEALGILKRIDELINDRSL